MRNGRARVRRFRPTLDAVDLETLKDKLAAIDAKPLAEVSAAEVGMSLHRRLRSVTVREVLPQPLRDIALVLHVDDFVMLRGNGFTRFVEQSPACLLATKQAVDRIEGNIRRKVFERVLSHLPTGWEQRSPEVHRRSVKKLLATQRTVVGYLRGNDKGWQYAHGRWPKPSPHAAKFIRENARELDRVLKKLSGQRR